MKCNYFYCHGHAVVVFFIGKLFIMMTSSNGNIFRVTGHLRGEFTVPGEFPAQRPVTRSFDVFFDLRLNKRLSKQSWGWLFETLSCPLCRHCNDRTQKPTERPYALLSQSNTYPVIKMISMITMATTQNERRPTTVLLLIPVICSVDVKRLRSLGSIIWNIPYLIVCHGDGSTQY